MVLNRQYCLETKQTVMIRRQYSLKNNIKRTSGYIRTKEFTKVPIQTHKNQVL